MITIATFLEYFWVACNLISMIFGSIAHKKRLSTDKNYAHQVEIERDLMEYKITTKFEQNL